MRLSRAGIVIVLLIANVAVLAAASSLRWGFENPVTPLSAEAIPVNANKTGNTSVSKLREQERVHQNFMNSTNSCASCHMTHTSSGRELLFQSTDFESDGKKFFSEYNTCMTCHDGSFAGAYNVLDGLTLSGSHWASAGIFYDERIEPEPAPASVRNAVSYHLATGTRRHGQAPGALTGAESQKRYTRRGTAVSGNWEQPFTCGSCHAPHGTYSKRHLQYNPNGQARRYENIPLVHVSGDLYKIADQALLPWLYYDKQMDPELAVYVFADTGSGLIDITDEVKINYAKGEVLRTNLIPVSVTFTQAFVINMDIANQYSTTMQETVTHRNGTVAFCTSCHIGYLDTVESKNYGWHDRFYHPVEMDVTGKVYGSAETALTYEVETFQKRMTCLTCHFAHGTDLSRLQRRGSNWLSTGELVLLGEGYSPANTVTLRYFNPDNGDGSGGRFESCYLCHGEFKNFPGIKKTNPAHGTYAVPAGLASIDIYFNQIMDESTLTTAEITVTDGVYGVTGSVAYSSVDRVFSFYPDSLDAGKDYTVTLSTGIRTMLGGYLKEEYSFTFHTYPQP